MIPKASLLDLSLYFTIMDNVVLNFLCLIYTKDNHSLERVVYYENFYTKYFVCLAHNLVCGHPSPITERDRLKEVIESLCQYMVTESQSSTSKSQCLPCALLTTPLVE